jgi:succinate dehydrogenase/fumarate reductase flavoprotein subunit
MEKGSPLRADVLVAGAGIGGLVAARSAQEAGASVVLLEKAPTIGGSAAVSGGSVWCAADLEAWLSVQPGGDPALGQALIDGYSDGIEWLPSQGVSIQLRADTGAYKFRRVVYQFLPDARTAMDTLAEQIREHDGTILVGHRLSSLQLDATGGTRGVTVVGPDGRRDIEAAAVILATGGFQASPELRARYLGHWADRMILRGNAYSSGDGFQAAVAAGAGTAGPFSRFYGHMVPAPPAEVGLHNYAQVKPDFSEYAIFVNLHGERFDDEFLGDEVTVHATVRQPEALCFLVFDEEIRRTHAAAPPGAGANADRLRNIREAGGEILEAPSLEELADEMSTRWGVHGAGLLETLETYNRAAHAGDGRALRVAKSGGLEPIETAPFYALRLLPGITFTYGGARVDRRAQVLDSTGQPLPGLFAAGADAGGIYTRGYTGGLSIGLAYGRIAGKEAAAYVHA